MSLDLTTLIISIINILIIVVFMGMGIYSFILFVKLAKRALKAIEIFNDEKESNL